MASFFSDNKQNFIKLSPILGILLALLFVFSSTSNQIFHEWLGNGAYSHGFLALIVMLFLLWHSRDEFEIASSVHWLPLIGIIASCAVWMIGAVANVFILESLAMLGILSSSLGLVYKAQSWPGLLTPMLTMLLVIPIWDPLQPPLQSLAADVSFVALQWLGIPVLRQGFMFTVPGGSFYIEAACSGMGFFLSSCLLSVLYSRMNRLSNLQSISLFLIAASLAIFSNWIRILLIMIIGNMTNMESPFVKDHLTFGWIIFGFMQIPFFLIANYLFGSRWFDEPRSPAHAVAIRFYALPLVTIAALLLATPVLLATLEARQAQITAKSDWVFEEAGQLFSNAPYMRSLNLRPDFVGASDVQTREYSSGENDFEMLSVRYDKQSQGAELISVKNSFYDESYWRPIADKRLNHLGSTRFDSLVIANARGERFLVTYAYVVAGRLTRSPYLAKAYEVYGFFSDPKPAYMIAIIGNYRNQDQLESLLSVSDQWFSHLNEK